MTNKNDTIRLLFSDSQKAAEVADIMTEKEKIIKLYTENVYSKFRGKDKRYYTYFPDATKKGGRRKVAKTKEEDLDNEIVDFCIKTTKGKTIGELYNDYFTKQYRSGKITGATLMSYNNYFKRWYIDQGIAKEFIVDFTERDIRDFLKRTFESAEGGRMTAKEYQRLRTPLRGILEQAYDERLIDYTLDQVPNPIKRGDFKKSKKDTVKEVFNHDELKEIVNYLYNNQDLLNKCILLLFISGMRVGEAVSLKAEDIDLINNRIHVHRTESRELDNHGNVVNFVRDAAKTDAGNRYIPIPEEFAPLLRTLRNDSAFREWVFMYTEGQYKGQRIKTSGIRRRLNRICDKVSITKKTPHKARHTYASLLDEYHIDRKTIAALMGHKHPTTTDNYYQFDVSTNEEVVQALQKVHFGL